MRDFIATYLENKGYDVNDKAQGIIKECDDWYANRVIEDFHKRTTVHGTQFEFNRMGFASDVVLMMQICVKWQRLMGERM